VQQSSDKEFTA